MDAIYYLPSTISYWKKKNLPSFIKKILNFKGISNNKTKVNSSLY